MRKFEPSVVPFGKLTASEEEKQTSIEILETLLARAKSGETVEVIVIEVSADTWWKEQMIGCGNERICDLVGKLDMIKHELQNRALEYNREQYRDDK